MEQASERIPTTSYFCKMDQESEQIPTTSYVAGNGKRKLRGLWRATGFVFVYEAWERMALLMVLSILVDYFQSDMRESNENATRKVKLWVGVSYITTICGGYLADAYLGFFKTIWIFSSIYILGFFMMTMSAALPFLNPSLCHKTVCPAEPTILEIVFSYVALYLLTVGTGGVWPAIPAFGADQFDDKNLSELLSRSSFFNWFFFSGALGSLIAWTVLSYAEHRISAQWRFGFPTISMSVALAAFLFGIPFYRYKKNNSQPLKRVAQVVVAAVRKRKVALPLDESRLYEDCEAHDHRVAWNDRSSLSPQRGLTRKLYHTPGFRCLDRAAVIGSMKIVEGTARIPVSRWNLCSVTQVEELKLVLRITPIWFSTLMFNVVKAQVPTFFLQQGQTMDRSIGQDGIRISAVSMQVIIYFVIVVIIPGYDLVLVPCVRRCTRNERGFSLLQRIGIGMLFSILTMVAAALTVIERRKHDELNILWMCPQYILQGLGEVFTSVGQLEFFYDQAPDSMRGMAAALYFTNYGVAVFLSSLLSMIVNVVSRTDHRPGWADASNIDRERLDMYYWALAVLGSVNFLFYMILASNYKYKKVDKREILKDSRSFEWNMSELGLMQKPTLFKHISTLKEVKEDEENIPQKSPLSEPLRSSINSYSSTTELSPL